MIIKPMSRKPHLVDSNIKIYFISILISFKFNYMPYKIEKYVCLYLFNIK